ncbi:uncharacterized protein LOC132315832 [Cornus florida]|uniref:uncharacterized protein LOC132315832 n=1 Tax=Cornus florida TaxID=4283 RepID=UPI0028A08793|nr:uncharacterized protein LOC132315832 [Cornus florida]
MGLFTYTLAGGGFILIGALESLISSSETLKSKSPPFPANQSSSTTKSTKTASLSPSVTFTAISLLSFFFILNSIISSIDAANNSDHIGVAIQLQVIAIASLFFLYSVLGLLTHFNNWISLPSPILNLLCLFAFVEEFLLFYLQRKDPSGIENRYFDLLLVPIGVCVVSTVLECRTPKSHFARLGLGIGLVLQGMWFIQMGLSFYSNWMAHGCSLHDKSRGNYTVRCKGHPEYHRGRAIATLQFNCHLALLVVLVVGVFSVLSEKNGPRVSQYRPLGSEMQHLDGQAHFTLDSDDDNEDGIREEGNGVDQKAIVIVPELGVNGHGSHQ